MYRTFFDLGSVLGPIVMTAVFAAHGIAYCFYVSTVLLAVSVPLAMMIRENTGPSGAHTVQNINA